MDRSFPIEPPEVLARARRMMTTRYQAVRKIVLKAEENGLACPYCGSIAGTGHKPGFECAEN